MKNLLIGLIFILTTQVASSAERPFRILRNAPTALGYAIAWGIPGVNLDFEHLDTLSSEELDRELDFSAIRNYIVDTQTNAILATTENEDGAVFSVGDMSFGNHYSLSLHKLAVQDINYGIDAVALIEHYKWSNGITKILLIDRNEPKLKVSEVDAQKTMGLLNQKLKLSILPKNMELYEGGAENIYSIETKYLERFEEVNVFTFDYSFPKSMDNSLEVITTVKMKFEAGSIIPYILSVKQKQY